MRWTGSSCGRRWPAPTLTVEVAHQGVVAVKNVSLLYPYTAVNADGVGYLLFSLSGRNNYPSPAYITYNVDGPTGSVIEATPGSAPEDGFTCYAAFVGPNYGDAVGVTIRWASSATVGCTWPPK